jgi:hypothetical protein
MVTQIAFSAPRLYLGAGVTTLRTTGNIEGYTDLEVKRSIDAGRSPGPDIDATAPYLEGPGSIFPQMHQLKDGDDAREMVAFWARRGATSFKAYMNVTRAQLGAAIEAAHALGLKVTGHLCSVTWREAIALGIDDLEHGPVFSATDFQKDKQPDQCPASGTSAWSELGVDAPEVQSLIRSSWPATWRSPRRCRSSTRRRSTSRRARACCRPWRRRSGRASSRRGRG